MARDDGGAAGTVVVAFVLGAITGAAVALLMAPASGEETRRVLAEKANEGREKAADAARQGQEFLNRQRDTLEHGDRSRPGGLQAGAQRGAAGSRRGHPVNLSETFLGIIAAATLLMALIQVGAIVAILRVARQAQQTIAEVQRDVAPAAREGHAVADEASRTATIATAQAEKIDRLLTDLAVRSRPDRRCRPAGDHHAGPRGAGDRGGAQGRFRGAARLPRASAPRPGG